MSLASKSLACDIVQGRPIDPNSYIRIRRIKCDEAKPECKRCTSTGRTCDGYTATSDSASQEKRIVRVQPIPSKGLAFGAHYSALEKRTFDFFRTKTAPCMSGYFQDPVWERLALQASHTEPVIRYAVNALGALHEERLLRADASKGGVETSLVQSDFPVRQYAKALAGLQKLLSSGKASINVVLLCALLCVHYESLQERFIPALTHAENAMRLLDPSQAPSNETIDPSLIRAFIRIDLQGTFFIDGRLPSMSFITSATNNELPAFFTDLEHARSFVITWSSRLFKFLREMAYKYRFDAPGFFALESLAEAQKLEQVFVSIDQLILSFMRKSNAKLTFREHHGLNMLRVLAMENRIIAAASVYREASFHDRYLPEMKQMLSICQFVMDAEDPSNRLLSASLDDGMLRPLSFIVMQCRDSRTRRSALSLLKQLPEGQVAWHVDAITQAVERCVELEERDCEKEDPRCEDIPEWRRVHSFEFDSWILASRKRSKVVATIKLRPNGMDGEWVELHEEIEW